ncbi:hypothetical protein EU537_04480 [Candidatus Thorarchaeota archaeon]|nr:MAG: hypothetical protein EU537_04480 [Candidatus Thorarchaeota archaeon]
MGNYLLFDKNESQWRESFGEMPDEGISLSIDDTQKKLIMNVPANESMIIRRAAERQARGISKSGYLSRSGERIGRGYRLEIDGEGGQLPDRLRQSPREVY